MNEVAPKREVPLGLAVTIRFLRLLGFLFAVGTAVLIVCFLFSVSLAVEVGAGSLKSALTHFGMLLLMVVAYLTTLGADWMASLLLHQGLPEKYDAPHSPLKAIARPPLIALTIAPVLAVAAGVIAKFTHWESSWAWLAFWIPFSVAAWAGLRMTERRLRTRAE